MNKNEKKEILEWAKKQKEKDEYGNHMLRQGIAVILVWLIASLLVSGFVIAIGIIGEVIEITVLSALFKIGRAHV